MFRKLHTKYKLSFAIFTIAFVFFLLFVLIDDAVVKGGTALALRSLLWLRLGTAFVFSSALGGLTLFILHLTYKSLRSLTHLFQSWTQDVYEETGESERNDEIGELARSFRIALFQKKEKEADISHHSLLRRERELSNKLEALFHRVRLHKIRNLDITIFPRTSEDSSCDYGNVIPTADGCLGILAGFPNNGFLESGMKARIEGMISLAQETTGIRGEDLLYKLDRALRSTPIPYLNLTLFYIETRTGEIGFLQCQELPILIHRQNRTVSLEQPKRRFYDFRAASRDIQRTVLKQGEFIVVLSDRLKELAGGERKILLSKLQNWTAGKEFRNTRELVLDFGRWLEAEAGKKTLYKASILSVGRVWN